jgi:CRP-like cAMP-binding protein
MARQISPEPWRAAVLLTVDTNRIAAFPDFANLPAEELNELAGVMHETEIEAGVTVIRIDEYGTALYLIEAGDADVLDDRDDVVGALGPGEIFGEIALLLTAERTATVVARTPMRVLSLSGQDFDQIRSDVPEVERRLRRLGIRRAGE